MASRASFPSPEDGLALHRCLLEGDPTAPSDVAAACLEPLIAALGPCNPTVDPHMIGEAAEEAILALIKNPASYRPGGLDLAAYLQMAAQADMKNALKREGRHHRHRADWAAVELSDDPRNNLGRDDDPALPLLVTEGARALRALVPPAVLEGLVEAEIRVLELMLQRERRTRVYAEAYGVLHLATHEQRRVIKQVKDKLKKRMERAEKRNEPTP
jgi:hypothetical protein